MNQCAQSFKALDTAHTGKVNRDRYYEVLTGIILANEIPVPSQHILADILDVATPGNFDVMFNEFCVCLFSHSHMFAEHSESHKPVFLIVTSLVNHEREKEQENSSIIEPAQFKKILQ